MKLKKLFKRLKELKTDRVDYYIKPNIEFYIDDRDYCFAFLPTIIYEPWIYRRPKCCVIEIWWLNIHITIGEWRRKDIKNDNT